MLESKLKSRLVELYYRLDNELVYVDRKDCVPEMKLRKEIDIIEGFILGIQYMRGLESSKIPKDVIDTSKRTHLYISGNSILDNLSDYMR